MFYLSWNWTKSGSTILHTLMLLMKIMWSFVWRKFSSLEKGEWCDEMKDGQKLKLGDAHVTPKNIQEVQASKLGDAQGTPFSSTKISGHISRHYIFIASYTMCYSWSVSCFCFKFCLVFVCCSILLDPSMFVLERDTLLFHCLEHSSSHSYCPASVHFSLALRLALVFHSYFVQSLLVFLSYIWLALWSLLINLWELFQISWLVLEKSNMFHAHSSAKGSLFRLWLRL
jgi:hypothetical protein